MLEHRGYLFRLFDVFIPLPLALILGTGYAEETPVCDDEFSTMVEIRHPWWGKVFGYDGTFRVTRDA